MASRRNCVADGIQISSTRISSQVEVIGPSTTSGARLRNLLGIDRMSSAIRHSFDCVAACARILGMLFTELTPSVVRRRLFQSTYISSRIE
ncbi:hypothetical protein PISMIDRAFT_680440, partial [Pisolithus microcarpus 441]